ncbi:MAG TPA: glycosyltransferase [Burkholderiaceae bacterium]|nr:glycosyltransferase [Burkholderiaceae bacterium]HNG77857.1 glycosyltransferase [Burkholderiaceae bacterium]
MDIPCLEPELDLNPNLRQRPVTATEGGRSNAAGTATAPTPPSDAQDTLPAPFDEVQPTAEAGTTRPPRPERPMPMSGSVGRVVHCVGRLDCDEAHGLLWPTVLALADAGLRQCVVLLHPADAEHARLLLPRSVPLVVAAPGGVLQRWRRDAQDRIAAELRAEPVLAVHLHGHAGAFAGLAAMQEVEVHAPVFFHTPQHPASGWPMRALTRWLARLAQGRTPAGDPPAYLVQPGRVDPLSAASTLGDAVLAEPVHDIFFHTPHAEVEPPRVATRGRSDDVAFAARYAQIAVLLAGSAPTLQFAWIGAADEAVQAVLKAAQVQILPGADPTERAAQLAQAWIYLAPCGDALDARGVLEAMAIGLPCVTHAGGASAELVIDQLSGLVGDRDEALLQAIAALVDSSALRQRLGDAARERSLLRYSRHRFQASLLLAHGLPASSGAEAAAPRRLGRFAPA